MSTVDPTDRTVLARLPGVDESQARQRVLTAAADFFGRKGFAATSIQEILGAAAVSKGGFYHHFQSKMALYEAVLGTFVDLLEKDLLGTSNGASVKSGQSDGGGERPDRAGDGNPRAAEPRKEAAPSVAHDELARVFVRSGPRDAVFYTLLVDGVRVSEAVKERVRSILKRAADRYAHVLEAGQNRGEVRDLIDPEVWSLQMLSMVEGLLLLDALGLNLDLGASLAKMFDHTWRSVRSLSI